MHWERYKLICDSPNVFSRWMLEQTLELVGAELGSGLERALVARPVPKPPDHRGGPSTDMFELSLAPAEVLAIHEAVVAAADAGRTTSATRRRGVGGFAAAWREYADHLAVARGGDSAMRG